MAGELPPKDGPAPASKPKIRIFQCPNCGATLEIRAVGQTITVGCRACGSTLDTAQDEVKLVEKGQLLKRNIHVPIGSRGTFSGQLFEVIGVMGRVDLTTSYAWKEYLLYNPYQGFRWLSEAGGHWNFVVPIKEAPRVDDDFNFKTGTKPRATLGGRMFTHFQNSDARVEYVLGEFYWRVKKGDRSKLADYVDPPELLSCESNGNERMWSRCTYLTPEEIQSAFKLPTKLPYPVGIAPNQPNTRLVTWRALRGIWAVFTLACLFLFVFHHLRSPRLQVFQQSLLYDPLDIEKVKKIGPFEITGTGNFEIRLNASLNNAYLDVDADLVNESTGRSYDLQLGAEYWSGYDSDGSWNEGSTSSSDLETGIGPGTYHVNLTPSAGSGAGKTPQIGYTVSGVRGVPVGSNLFLVWLLLSVFPIWVFLRASAFESERWSGSDYAPMDGGDEDE